MAHIIIKKIPIKETRRSPVVMMVPLFILSIGAIITGFIFKDLFIGNNNENFWQSSIFFLEKIEYDYIPLWFFSITPLLVIISIPISIIILFQM